MAYQFEIDTSRRLIVERWTGDVTYTAVADSLEEISRHADFDHGFDAISNYAQARLRLSADDLRRIQSLVRSKGWTRPGRRALVAPRDLDFAVARQAEGLWQLDGFVVFRDEAAAVAWLRETSDEETGS